MRILTALLALFVVLLNVVGGAQTREPAARPLLNKDIISLVEAGLPEAVIVEKIRTSRTAFDTSTEQLLALKQAGVPGSVIQLMINPASQPQPTTTPSGVLLVGSAAASEPEPCKTASDGRLPWLSGASPAMWYLDAQNGRIEIQYERGTLHRVGFMGIGATLLLLKPLSAQLRLSSDTVFYSCINPTEAPLVRFSLDEEDDERNTSVARGGPWNHSFRISDEDLVPMAFRKLPQGFFEIKARTSLKPGEYGFVPQAGFNYFVAGERVYAFGVDSNGAVDIGR